MQQSGLMPLQSAKHYLKKGSVKSVSLLLRKLRQGQSIVRKPSTGRPSKMTQRVKDIIEEQPIKLSRSTILRCCRKLGWTYRGAAYCQIIREANKLKRLSWCLQNQTKDLKNVIWTDETTVQLENHRHFSHRKRGEKPRPKPGYWTSI